jgi:hypothetical protein
MISGGISSAAPIASGIAETIECRALFPNAEISATQRISFPPGSKEE